MWVSLYFSALTPGSWLDWSDWSTLARFYSPEQAYGNSKVAQVLSTQHLARIMDTQVRRNIMRKEKMTKPVLSGPWCEGVQHPPWYCLHRPLCQCLVDEANVSVGQVCDTLWCLLSTCCDISGLWWRPRSRGETLWCTQSWTLTWSLGAQACILRITGFSVL